MRSDALVILPEQTFNNWTTISYIGNGRNTWLCRCVCGAERPIHGAKLVSGQSKSCGCVNREHPLRGAYNSMMGRCYYAPHPRYGQRGITVCEEWRDSFAAYRDWALAHGWQPGLEIDRKNNDLGYSPDNCRVVTHLVNQNNTSHNTILEALGEKKTMIEWSRDPRCRVSYKRLIVRINAGWSDEDAILIPARQFKQAA